MMLCNDKGSRNKKFSGQSAKRDRSKEEITFFLNIFSSIFLYLICIRGEGGGAKGL